MLCGIQFFVRFRAEFWSFVSGKAIDWDFRELDYFEHTGIVCRLVGSGGERKCGGIVRDCDF